MLWITTNQPRPQVADGRLPQELAWATFGELIMSLAKISMMALVCSLATSAMAANYVCGVAGNPTTDQSGTVQYQVLATPGVLTVTNGQNSEIYSNADVAFILSTSDETNGTNGPVIDQVAMIYEYSKNSPAPAQGKSSDTSIARAATLLGTKISLEDSERKIIVDCEPVAAANCAPGQVLTAQYSCLPQGNCPAGMGEYNSSCVPGK